MYMANTNSFDYERKAYMHAYVRMYVKMYLCPIYYFSRFIHTLCFRKMNSLCITTHMCT